MSGRRLPGRLHRTRHRELETPLSIDTLNSIAELRELARRRVPRMFYDYADSGSWSESTYRANEADFARLLLRQRVARDIGGRSLATTMLGRPVAMPVALAPAGLAGMQHADGEILAARAACAFGVPFTLSTMSICSIEDVAAHVDRPFWFQLYVMRDRDFMRRLIARAKAAQCEALVLTLDLQVLGVRHKDVRNGLSAPPKLRMGNIVDIARRPRWWSAMLRTRRRTFGNIVGHVRGVSNTGSLSDWISTQFDPHLNWDDVARIRDLWDGRFIVKGILDVEDARLAASLGVDAVVVSNHGGRQLDGAPSAIAALPAVVDAIGERTEVWMDGGIRSGQDVLKAVASGARATMIGRPFLYGLGAMGEAGVTRCLQILHDELDRTLALCGHRDILDVGRETLVDPRRHGAR